MQSTAWADEDLFGGDDNLFAGDDDDNGREIDAPGSDPIQAYAELAAEDGGWLGWGTTGVLMLIG